MSKQDEPPFRIYPAASWMQEQFNNSEPSWLIRNMVPWNGVTLISGPAKHGQKSWLAYAMAIACASGKGRSPLAPSEAVPVWYINREGGGKFFARRLAKLANSLGVAAQELEDNLLLTHGGDFHLDNPEHVRRALHVIEKRHIKLLFIDTLGRSRARIGDENSARDMDVLIDALMKFREAGASVVVVHHVNKATPINTDVWPDTMNDVRGSTALTGAVDVHIAVRRYRIDGAREVLRYMMLTGKDQNPAELGYFFGDVEVSGKDDELLAIGEWPTGTAEFAMSPVPADHFDAAEPEADDDY